MVVGPWVMSYAPIDSLIWVPSALCAEFPYSPVVAMFGVEESDEAVKGIAVGSLRIGLAWTGANSREGGQRLSDT